MRKTCCTEYIFCGLINIQKKGIMKYLTKTQECQGHPGWVVMKWQFVWIRVKGNY